MDIVLICNFWHFEFEKKSSRYRTMADVLTSEKNFDVEIITSSFRHQTKMQRDLETVARIKSQYKMTLLPEPSYKKNISLQRVWSHHCFAQKIKKYLQMRKKPDVIICSVPSLAVGSVVTKYAEKNKVKVIVDIQDLWPEAFKMAFNFPVLSDILFAPMMIQANKIYSRADKIMAVSDTYVKRGLENNKKDKKGLSIYIGTDSKLMLESITGKKCEKPENEFWIGYIGSLGYSYDIRSIIDAIHILNEKGYRNIVFKVMGEGDLLNEFIKYANERKVDCDFMGFLEYGEMMSVLMACDIAVNPIIGSSVSSIINKVSDYAMAGIPVVNTQNSQEYRKLIKIYNCGVNCENGNIHSIADALYKLYLNPELRDEMGKNGKKLADEKFDRLNTYPQIIDLIKELAGKV